MSKGDMVNVERLTPEVERERGEVTTWGKQTGSRLDISHSILVRPYRPPFTQHQRPVKGLIRKQTRRGCIRSLPRSTPRGYSAKLMHRSLLPPCKIGYSAPGAVYDAYTAYPY